MRAPGPTIGRGARAAGTGVAIERRMRDPERVPAAPGRLVDATRAGDGCMPGCVIIESLAGGPAASRRERS